jgi:hypothetical protein
MRNPLNPKTLEERVYRSRADDGLFDITLGLVYLGLGLLLRTDGYSGLTVIVVAVILPVTVRPLLRARVGDYAKLRADRREKLRKWSREMELALLLGVTGGAVYFAQDAEWASRFFAVRGVPLMAMAAAMTLAGGLILRIPRIGGYGVMVGAALVFPLVWGIAPDLALMVLGVAVAAVGVMLFGLFIARNAGAERNVTP